MSMQRDITMSGPKVVSEVPLNRPEETTLSISLCAQYVTGLSVKFFVGHLSPSWQTSLQTATAVTSEAGIVM